MTGRTIIPVTLSLFIFVVFVLFGCAEVGPPPGGPEDKSPPIVVQSIPENGAINVAPAREITFWFSEGITRPSGNKTVFIAPRQKEQPELNWKSDRLIIKLKEEFQPNQTYVVTLTSDITDWRRNKMDSTMTIAFSTGDKIDTGTVSGVVLSDGQPNGGILIGLYKLSEITPTFVYDSVYPDYLTQSASDGTFRFRYLPDTKFQLAAFEDVLRNERFNPKEEPFAVSDRPINIGGGMFLQNLNLVMSPPADAEPKIVSAILTNDKLLKVRTNITLPVEYISQNLSNIRVYKSTDSLNGVRVRAFLESHKDEASVFTFAMDNIDTGKYSIIIPFSTDKQPLLLNDVIIPKIDDKNAPSVFEFNPDNKAHFLEQIKAGIVFSEPIDKSKLTDGTFELWNSEEQSVPITTNWLDDFHLSIKINDLVEGGKYKMTVAEFEIADLAGNLLGDSIQTFEFSVLDSDSIGSVSGTISVRIADKISATKQLKFKGIKNNQTVEITVPANSFNAILPAGKYLLSGYLDENSNNKRDNGSVEPYTYSETFVNYTDTISVRARFETAGIQLEFK